MFAADFTEEEIKREKSVARELRKSGWWKRRCSEGRCYYCNSKVHPRDLTMDHVVPLIRGGKSTKGNVVASCKECNTKKGYLLHFEWDKEKSSKKS
ncbi:HNH endonuclease [Thermodesulfovibrionales bacterium]|nr:HNH endonuclease [Thermodesulfovibrionales bacterium]MCL0042090.1 HNH endonuclease [Thermodesulfovibrionales bacterium]MCL0046722.1 HNH endonuclease [Thermodesulfovibrionales bacterium]MCL0051111.1 HNH endonuclease [Thermodesulfovibrionales bacterium]